jgi:DNA-binding transcriptional LysR family regulator
MGCHPAVASYVLPTLLEKMNVQAPGIELELFHDFSRKIVERIVTFELDLAYVVNPIRHPELVLVKLGEDRISFWNRRGIKNPPTRLLADANRAEIEPLLGRVRARTFGDFTLLQTSSLELIRTLTLDGQGVGILPERVALADSDGLVPFDERLPGQPDEIFLAYRKEAMTSRAAKALLEMARVKLV